MRYCRGTLHENAHASMRKFFNESYFALFLEQEEILSNKINCTKCYTFSTLKPDTQSDEGISQVQKEDSDIKSILEFKESSNTKQNYQNISTCSPITKRH